MAWLSFFLFGSYQILLDKNEFTSSLPVKGRALLAYLVREHGPQRRDKLAGLLWPDCSESQAHHNLSQTVYALRRVFAQKMEKSEWLRLDTQEIELNSEAGVWVDVAEFSGLLEACERHSHLQINACPECFERLQRAAALYRGAFLVDLSLKDGVSFDEWCMVQREHLHRQAMQVLQWLSEYHTAQGQLEQALKYARRQVEFDPLGEVGHRQLILLLSESGRRNEALVHFQTLQCTLRETLGVTPDAETLALVDSIQHQTMQPERTSLQTVRPSPKSLPESLTPFIGRTKELVELTGWLRTPGIRLITILGSGGSGKTRLALQVARDLHSDFPDGIFFVSLSGLRSGEAFLPTLASTLGVVLQSTWGDPFEQLLGYLHHHRLLLILDSFEEVSDAAQQVSRMLQAAVDIRVLVTSRVRLNLEGEHIFLLDGMPFPGLVSLNSTAVNMEDYPALQLFQSIGRHVHPDFSLSAEDIPHLAKICQLVAGMPLGLVLAAGWLGTFSPAEIAEEIGCSLDFLSSSWNDVPDRQRSMRATLDHSWRMLDEDERQAFQKLSVFQGAFTRFAAEQITQVSAAELRRLMDKSILQIDEGKYRMHDLLRQYAQEKLAMDTPVSTRTRDAHSVFYLARITQCEPRLKSAQRSSALREMDTEISDYQVAWEWSCKQANRQLLAASLEGLCLYYEMRMSFRAGALACQIGLSARPVPLWEVNEWTVLRARFLLWYASFQVALGELEPARQTRHEAGELLTHLEDQNLDVRRPQAMYWQAEGDDQADLKIKLEYYQRSITLYHELGDGWREAAMLIWAGEFAMRLGDASLALQYQFEALRLSRQAGEPNTLLHSLRQITFLHFALNQYETAHQFIKETTAFIEKVDELPLRANTDLHLGMTLIWNGCFPEAICILENVLPLLRSLGYRYGVAFGTFSLGIGYVLNGESVLVENLLQATFPETDQGGYLREAAGMLVMLGMAALAQGHLAQAHEYFQEGITRYSRMQFAGELGMALGGLALAQEMCGQLEAAQATLVEALQIVVKNRNLATMLTCLPAMVFLLAHHGRLDAALLVHRITLLQSVQKNSRWYSGIIGDEMATQWGSLSEAHRAQIDAAASQHNPFSIIPDVIKQLTVG